MPKVTSTTTSFRFATDILRRLGEELNPSPDQGLMELVKNAYDANATECIVELLNTNESGGLVRITDDGDGMSSDEIKNGWLVLGKSSKSTTKLTRLGRVPAGNKGLGRLAALRMGNLVDMTTRSRSESQIEHELKVDWSRFSQAELVDDVGLKITTQSTPKNAGCGTKITIQQLRQRINRWDVRRLARAMLLLADPFGDAPSGFKPKLISPEYADLEQLVEKRYFTESDYHLTARVKAGLITATVSDWQGKVLFKGEHKDVCLEDSKTSYLCPDASFDFWVFILAKTSFESRNVSIAQVKEWLGEFGGVHLFHNGLRVSPYGNPGHDWLDLNLLRNRNPEERPSTNTSVGKVEVHDRKTLLIQKTDRSGFIETEAFVDLRRFAMDSLEWMARRRMEVAEKRRAQQRNVTKEVASLSKRKLDEIIESTPKTVRGELQDAAAAYDKSREKQIDRLKKEVQLYRTLATAGITAATFAHESSGNPIKIIRVNIKTISRRGRLKLLSEYDKVLKEPVENVEMAADSLGVLGSATLDLLDHEKRKLGKVEVHRVIAKILKTFDPFLKGRDVHVIPKLCIGNPYFRGSDAAFESVITNLLNNSLAFFEKAGTRNRKIVILTEVQDSVLTLRVMDNGPGIEDIRARDIWLPGQSTRSGGTGLGLTIVRDTVIDVGGSVDAKEKSELGGAEIIIEIPIIGT